jgi:hypothetical protein
MSEYILQATISNNLSKEKIKHTNPLMNEFDLAAFRYETNRLSSHGINQLFSGVGLFLYP